MVVLLATVLVVITLGKKGGHHGPPPTPTPSPTVTPTPSPSPTPIPQVRLAWDPNVNTGNPDTDAAGYHLCMGFAPGNEPNATDTGLATVWTFQLSPHTTYYFVVKAYNKARIDSLPSNEVSFLTP